MELFLLCANTIPVMIRIEGKQRILEFGEVNELLKKAELISIGPCYCRKEAQKCDAPINVCLEINAYAKKSIDKESRREINYEKAIEILKETYEAGLVLVTYDDDIDREKPSMICSCCSCCCSTLNQIVINRKMDLVKKSPYIISYNKNSCSLCGNCVERCQFKVFTLQNNELNLDYSVCHGCGLCINNCNHSALNLIAREI